MKRIKYGKEPTLAVHRYVLEIGRLKKGCWHSKFKYAVNLKEVRAFRKAAPKGSIIHIFKAHHDFREGWEK